MTDVWGIGPESNGAYVRSSLLKVAAYIGGLFGLVYLWDPAQHAFWVSAAD